MAHGVDRDGTASKLLAHAAPWYILSSVENALLMTKLHIVFVSPPGFNRQAYVLLLLLSFFFFFNDRLEQRDPGNYKTDLNLIFRAGRHVGVDIHSGIGFPISQGTLS